DPENRLRAFPDFPHCASGLLRFCGFVGLRFHVYTQKRGCGSAALDSDDGIAAMNALTTEGEREQLLANGEARAAGRDIDPVPVVRLFTPDAHVTWLLAALDPADGDTAWGLIDLGIGMPTPGTVKLSELAGIVGPRQQPVMRDLYFRPTRTLSEYTRLAERDGAIPD